MYEIVTGDSVFSNPGGARQTPGRLQSGWRPDFKGVTELSRRIIEESWSMDSKARPSFQSIWKDLYLNDFDVVQGVKKGDVESFLGWVENS
jgi:hypothetical protein